MLPRFLFLLSAISAFSAVNSSPVTAADWVHWRGPLQNGHALEKNLPDDFDPADKKAGNVVWRAPFGGRSAPLVMGGRVYITQGTGAGPSEAEQVVCVDEASGKLLWTYRVNVFHTDIVSTRVGWSSLTGDPATGVVYTQTTGGLLLALDPAGKVVWSRSLTEEYGRASGYGGRLPAPIYDDGLVIAPMVSSSWGDFARGTNRFVAFDAKTGAVVWWHDTENRSIETYCSHPVVAVINGQRLLVSGGADGYLHALKVRTGERVWSIQICGGAVNGSPVVDGNLVYCAHGDENPGGGDYGRVVCVDAGQVADGKPKLVWEHRGVRFGLANPALADGRLYLPSDTGDLFCFNAKTGKELWRYRYGNEVRGSPLVADGKVYIQNVQGRFYIIPLDGNKKPNPNNAFEYRFRNEPKSVYTETNGTPVAVNGRVYFVSAGTLWCLGQPDARTEPVKYPPLPAEPPYDPAAAPAGVRVFPADVVAKPGETVTFALVPVDASGRQVKGPVEAAEWSLPLPPKAPTGNQPPALQGKLAGGSPTGAALTLAPVPTQQGYVEAKVGTFAARARVRVAGQVGYKQDWEKAPAGSSPGGWVNLNGKFSVKKLPDGNQVLAKANTDPRPPIAKANAFVTLPDAKNYTISADLMGTQVRGGFADFGLINSRYVLVLDGKTDPDRGKRQFKLYSWEARPRISKQVDFDWQPDVWYSVKLGIEHREKTAVVRGKVWEKGKPEPADWTVEFEDPSPNREGAAGVYGYVTNASAAQPGSDAYYDNIAITPDK